MQQLLILLAAVTLVCAKTTFGDFDEGQSSSSVEVDHGGKRDQGYSFGGEKSSNEGFDQGSFGENESGFDENQEDGGYQQEDIGSQGGGDDFLGGGYEGQYSNEGFEQSKGSDDGESDGSYGDNRRGY